MEASLELGVDTLLADQEELEVASAITVHLGVLRRYRTRLHDTRCGARPRNWGSVRGRRPNKDRDLACGDALILMDSFGVPGNPLAYSESDFECRFRMPRTAVLRIDNAVRDRPWWRQSVNATGRPQSHALQKLVAALRVISYGEAAHRADEYCRISSSTIELAVKKLVAFLGEEFGPEYERTPNKAKLEIMLKCHKERGMPGCIGALDCSHWEWNICPKGLAGLFQNRKSGRVIVMETVCDEDLYICHLFVGCTSSMNVLNVMQQSPLYHEVTAGNWPPRDNTFTSNGRERTLLYNVVDGIYPHYTFFISVYGTADTENGKVFHRLQEALRKDAERLYAVLTARFHIALHHAQYATVGTVSAVAKAVAMLHNMVTENRRDGFVSRERMPHARGLSRDEQGDGCG